MSDAHKVSSDMCNLAPALTPHPHTLPLTPTQNKRFKKRGADAAQEVASAARPGSLCSSPFLLLPHVGESHLLQF